MRDWRKQDAALDAAYEEMQSHYEEMQSQPFEPTAGESVASVFGGLVYLGFVLVAVVLYLIGRAVVG